MISPLTPGLILTCSTGSILPSATTFSMRCGGPPSRFRQKWGILFFRGRPERQSGTGNDNDCEYDQLFFTFGPGHLFPLQVLTDSWFCCLPGNFSGLDTATAELFLCCIRHAKAEFVFSQTLLLHSLPRQPRSCRQPCHTNQTGEKRKRFELIMIMTQAMEY